MFIKGGSFPFEICFTVNMSVKEVRKRLEDGSHDEDWAKAFDCDDSFFNGSWGISLERKVGDFYYYFLSLHNGFRFSSDYDYCKLAHEVLHICQFALPKFMDRDVEFEAEAYTHTHIMDTCLDIMRTVNKIR